MAQEREHTPNTTAGGQQDKQSGIPIYRKVGNFIMRPDQVPAEIQAYVRDRLGYDAEGNPRKDEKGEEIKPAVVPAKENGSYKGTIILNSESYIVQSVGKEARTAVVHRKDDVELVGSKLKWRDENKKLHNADVQIYYNDDKAKAYPWDKNKTLGQEAAKGAPEKPALKPEAVLEKAQQYAADNIKNAKQREAFLKHMENMTQQFSAQKPEPARAGKTEQAKPAPDIER
ncbi:MAG: hypothetical protein LBI87_00950 [Candidatus Accumulibacter sp.]|jgi:hypothetical protein|nr:hypothetical protein [Accumulibacter sp.]